MLTNGLTAVMRELPNGLFDGLKGTRPRGLAWVRLQTATDRRQDCAMRIGNRGNSMTEACWFTWPISIHASGQLLHPLDVRNAHAPELRFPTVASVGIGALYP